MPRRMRATTALAAAAVTTMGLTGCSGFLSGNTNGQQGQSQQGQSNGAGQPAMAAQSGGQSGGNQNTSQASGNTDANQQIAAEIRLKSVSVRTANKNTARLQYVSYHFTTPLRQVTNPKGFYLTGYATTHPIQAQTAVLDENDPSTVVVGFPGGTPVQAYTLAGVANGAVANAHRATDLQNTVPIPNSYALRGLTSAPGLQSVSKDVTLDQVTFTFDKPIEAYGAPGSPGNPGNNANQGGSTMGASGSSGSSSGGNGNASNGGQSGPAGSSNGGQQGASGKVNPQGFGFYTPSGQAVTASSVVAVENNTVTVSFKGGRVDLNNAVRWFVKPNAVHSLQGRSNIIDATGGRTNAPDLVAGKQVNQVTYDFTFDEPVKNAKPQSFVLYTNGGRTVRASTVSTVNGARTIRARFAKAADFAGQVSAEAVGPQAVRADDTGGAFNTIGATAVNGGAKSTANGPTSGPDLQNVTANTKSGGVFFTFDEPVRPGAINKTGFYVVTRDGRLAQPRKVVAATGGTVTGNRVLVLFDESDLQSAQAFTVNAGAVQGTAGTPNPVRTIYANGNNS